VCLPGRVLRFPCPGPLPAGGVGGALAFGGGVICGVVRGFGLLPGGLGPGERVLGCRQPAAQFRKEADRLAAFPRLVCRSMILASGETVPCTGHHPQ